MLWLASLLILLVSSLFAMLGLGGSMLYVPILHWLGFGLKDVVIPLGLLLNGLTTLVALIPFGRKHLVDWKGGLPMAVSALVFAPVGALVAPRVPNHLLLVLFAILVFIAAIRTLSVANRPEPSRMIPIVRRSIVGATVSGVAGFLGGLLGIGGGFIISPMLMWVGYRTKEAAATTAYVVTFSSFTGFLGHATHMTMNPWLMAFTMVAVLVGALVGSWFMSNRAKPTWVKWFYGILLIIISGKMLWPLVF